MKTLHTFGWLLFLFYIINYYFCSKSRNDSVKVVCPRRLNGDVDTDLSKIVKHLFGLISFSIGLSIQIREYMSLILTVIQSNLITITSDV